MYHLIFVVKYRQKVFVEDIEIMGDIKYKIVELSERFDVEVLEIEYGIFFIKIKDEKPPIC
ncbi:MAG: transposase [Promethearchaeia archaeon]